MSYALGGDGITVNATGDLEVVYCVGFGESRTLGEEIETAIMLHVAQMYEGKGL